MSLTEGGGQEGDRRGTGGGQEGDSNPPNPRSECLLSGIRYKKMGLGLQTFSQNQTSD